MANTETTTRRQAKVRRLAERPLQQPVYVSTVTGGVELVFDRGEDKEIRNTVKLVKACLRLWGFNIEGVRQEALEDVPGFCYALYFQNEHGILSDNCAQELRQRLRPQCLASATVTVERVHDEHGAFLNYRIVFSSIEGTPHELPTNHGDFEFYPRQDANGSAIVAVPTQNSLEPYGQAMGARRILGIFTDSAIEVTPVTLKG